MKTTRTFAVETGKVELSGRSAPQWRIKNRKSKLHRLAFSLVEVLAAVALIGVITFLALPNIVRIKQDSEESLAISRAEALNLAMASYVQAHGRVNAAAGWAGADDNEERYALVQPYLAFAPANFGDFLPSGYTATLPATLIPLAKTTLAAGDTPISY